MRSGVAAGILMLLGLWRKGKVLEVIPAKKRKIGDFNEFIDKNMLVELPLVGKKFTWYKPDGFAKSRLDRFLVSMEWLQMWPTSKQYVQQREVSDHCAIVAKSWDKDWDPGPFKTIDAWLLEPGFKDLVKDKWNNYEVQGNRMSKLKDKLKLLKGDIKEWNRSIFGNIEESKRIIMMEIEKLDVKDAECDLL
ncbi:uncharacterized protein [Phaseolus vulgaris]|uniref:uncharacterized protein n=1 Tax=Phaseolus vulgaris TaxID=3885 RepID=UPI0035CA24C2